MQTASRRTRLILSILAFIIGLFMVAIAPFIVQTSLERVLNELLAVSQNQPQYSSGIAIFSLFYPLWRALGFVAGITLLVISPTINKGERWTFPISVLLYAIPAISGMFMFLPYISWVGGFPLPMVISWIGLAGFWSTILLQNVQRAQKIAWFVVLTLVGVLATHAFVIGIAAQRMLITRVDKPLFAGIEWWILTLSGEVNWLGVLLLMISIPFIAMRKSTGWRLALVATISIFVINVPTQILRTKTLDYLYGAIISLALLISLNLPTFKAWLIEDLGNPHSNHTTSS